METHILIAYATIAFGAIATLTAAYQLIKRGFLFWFLLIGVGTTAMNFGYNYLDNVPISAMLEELQPSTFKDVPIKNLRKLCEATGMGNQ